jgi:hypothetical protein
MTWFGKDWGAPVCRSVEHAATPVGRHCERCKKPIKKTDRGIIIPAYFVWHIDCFVRSCGGSQA